MLWLVLITLTLIIAGGLLMWTEKDQLAGQDSPGGGSGADDAGPAAVPTTLEGALVVQLLGGAITRAQYRAALARLAERDDDRHPMSVPDADPPEARP
ncbi:hypothetical protein AB0C07_22155 [Actinoplanes missouriensis]|uniref:hypothetical protein n=1 Tax=Actinoplanes missouriensis TaxID=1866 RepID=UPI0033D296E1